MVDDTSPTCTACGHLAALTAKELRELRELAALLSNVARGAGARTRAMGVTVRELFDEQRKRASEGALRNLEKVARNHVAAFMDVDVAELDAKRVSLWLAELRRNMKESTAREYWRILQRVVSAGVELAIIPAAPWGAWRPRFKVENSQPRDATRSPAEVLGLLEAARAFDERLRALGRYSDARVKVATAIALGLRNGEIAGLGWDDLHLAGDAPTVTIRHQALDGWKKKASGRARPLAPPKQRTVDELAIAPWLVELLEEHRAYLRGRRWYRADGPVFPAPRDGSWRASSHAIPDYLVARLARVAGLPGRWSPHSLRDSQCTLEMIAKRGDLRAVQARTRHRTLKSLHRYLHAATRGAIAPGIVLPDRDGV